MTPAHYHRRTGSQEPTLKQRASDGLRKCKSFRKKNLRSGEQEGRGQEAKQRCNNLNLTLQRVLEHKSHPEVAPPQGEWTALCFRVSHQLCGGGHRTDKIKQSQYRQCPPHFVRFMFLFKVKKIAYYLKEIIFNTLVDTCFIVPYRKQKLQVSKCSLYYFL